MGSPGRAIPHLLPPPWAQTGGTHGERIHIPAPLQGLGASQGAGGAPSPPWHWLGMVHKCEGSSVPLLLLLRPQSSSSLKVKNPQGKLQWGKPFPFCSHRVLQMSQSLNPALNSSHSLNTQRKAHFSAHPAEMHLSFAPRPTAPPLQHPPNAFGAVSDSGGVTTAAASSAGQG